MSFRLGTFSRAAGAPFAGLVRGDTVVPLPALAPLLGEVGMPLQGAQSVLALLENWDSNVAALCRADSMLEASQGAQGRAGTLGRQMPSENSLVGSHPADVESFLVSELRVHAPVNVPRQTFCTIANYRSHLVDTVRDPALMPRLGELDTAECLQRAAALIEERLRNPPYVCFKLPTTVIGATDDLEIPRHAQRADWELELGVIIGKPARRVSRSDAMSYVAGYTLVNDLTIRELVARPDLPRLGSDWLQSKNAPGFLPTGPYFVPAAFVPDPYALRLTLRLNGEVMQDELAADMLFDIGAQIEYISQHAQLLPGDLICTGTPAGCGIRYKRFLKPGDVIEASAPGFGTQRTTCVAEPPVQK